MLAHKERAPGIFEKADKDHHDKSHPVIRLIDSYCGKAEIHLHNRSIDHLHHHCSEISRHIRKSEWKHNSHGITIYFCSPLLYECRHKDEKSKNRCDHIGNENSFNSGSKSKNEYEVQSEHNHYINDLD